MSISRHPAPVWMTGLLAAAMGLGILGPATAGITTDPAPPIEGESTRILVTDAADTPVAGAEVTARYRPGSEVESEETVGTTQGDGSVPWTPRDAGLVSLETTNPADSSALSTNVAVRYQGIPAPGLAIMILAGVLLFGGVIRGFRNLKEPPPDLPPDT